MHTLLITNYDRSVTQVPLHHSNSLCSLWDQAIALPVNNARTQSQAGVDS